MRETGAKCEVHQDDVHACCKTFDGLVKFKAMVSKHLLMKWSEIMGLEGVYDHLKCRRIKTREGIFLLGAEKHTDKILELLSMQDCKPAPTPITVCRKRVDEDEEPLPPEKQSQFRSCVGVGRFLRHFKPEIGFAIKELSHRLKEAFPADEMRLKRFARYLAGTRRRGVFFPRHDQLAGPIKAISDTDWATDDISRRSTASGVIKISGCLLSDFCLAQNLVSTSSGEAEYYGGCAVVAEALHVQSILGFFDCRFAINWESDSSVARAISERLGVGRIKHLEVKALWLQEKVKGNEVLPLKVDTRVNPADLNTKVHAVSRFEFLLDLMGIVDVPGKVDEVTKTVNMNTGGISVSKKTLALAVALGELMGSGRAEPESAVVSLQCPSVVKAASGSDWLLELAVALLVLAWLIGICCGWKLSRWWVAPPQFLSVGTPASGGSVRKVNKVVQAQTTYSWKAATPRSVPLQVYAHGCWSGEHRENNG